ncbi:MAG: Dabb family protein [Bacteroidota bacterium]
MKNYKPYLAIWIISLITLLPSCAPKTEGVDIKKQLTHHVFVWLKNPDSDQDRNRLITGMKELEKIEAINAAHIGVPANTEQRAVVDHSYDLSLLLFFDDVEAQKVYQDHSIHLNFVEKHSDLWEKVVVYDTQASN